MNRSVAENCAIAVTLARSPILISALALCNLFCFIAIPLLVYWLIRIWKMELMHHNSRLLLCFHISWLLIYVTGRVTQHTTDLILYLSPFENDCDLMHTRIKCFFLRLPYNVATIVLNCSAIFISIERLVASFNTLSYERGFRTLGYCLLMLQVFVSACILSIMYSQTRLDQTPMLYCQATSPTNYMWTIYPFAFQLALQILSIIIFGIASRKNRGYSVAPYSIFNNLSKRYQMEENLWTIRTLKAYVYTNTSFTAAYLIAFSFVTFKNELFSKPVYYSLVEVTSTLYLYAPALPIVLWYNDKNVQRQINFAIRRNLAISPNRVFEELRSQWDMQLMVLPKRKPFRHILSLRKTDVPRR